MYILKFGGTTLAQAERIQQVNAIIHQRYIKETPFWVVVSALGNTTNHLITIAKQAQKDQNYDTHLDELKQYHLRTYQELNTNDTTYFEKRLNYYFGKLKLLLSNIARISALPPVSLDEVMSYGELLSITLVTNYLQSQGINCQEVDARQLLHTNRQYGQAEVLMERSVQRIQAYTHKPQQVQVITGFIASTPQGETTTLGRDGSNVTAAILGYALNAKEIELWTHVNGVCVVSPDILPEAHTIAQLSYQEAKEMAYYGANILHRRSMQPLKEKNITFRIKNIFHPNSAGTCVGPHKGSHALRGIASKENIALVRITGDQNLSFARLVSRVFECLAQAHHEVLFAMHASSEHALLLATDPDKATVIQALLKTALRQYSQDYRLDNEYGLSALSLVGEDIRHHAETNAKILQVFAQERINPIATAQGASQHSLCLIIQDYELHHAVKALYTTFFAEQKPPTQQHLKHTKPLNKTH